MGIFQFRISDALTVLPIFSLAAIPGLTLGTAIANTYCFIFKDMTPQDIATGVIATLIATILIYHIGKKCSRKICYIFGPLPVVILDAIFLGVEVKIINGESFFLSFVHIAITQIVVCYTLGLILMYVLYKNNLYKKIFQ